MIVFVFGSNEAGRHGKGAAEAARVYWGAEYGVGIGRTGDAYAIPTKDRSLKVLPLSIIERYVIGFLAYANARPEIDFQVTAVGCGLAGYTKADIAPLFVGATSNVHLPIGWRDGEA